MGAHFAAMELNATFVEQVETWLSNDSEIGLYVGVDLGGTNTRVAVGDSNSFVIAAEFKCNSSRVLIESLNEIAESINKIIDCRKHIKAGCLDAAGPVCQLGECVEITNYQSGEDNKHRNLLLSELPTLLFPVGHSRIINDLESACYGISGLNARNQIQEYFQHFLGPKPSDDAKLPFVHHLVIAVGTGMGVGLMMALPRAEDFIVLSLEGGHVHLSSAPANHERHEEESKMLKFISQEIYGGNHQLEYEDLASGRGLEALYKFFSHENGSEKSSSAAEISELVKTDDPIAKKALLYHYLTIARASANLAICLGAKGIFWAGGNQIHNGDFVRANKELLYKEFLHHPKKSWIESIPIFMQIKDFNVNLEGTLHVGRVILAN